MMPEHQVRLGLQEFGKFNSVLPRKKVKKESLEPKMVKTTRTSARISFRNKLRSMSTKRSHTQSTNRGIVDSIAAQQIETGNPAHKLLFLRLLGLYPKDANLDMDQSSPDDQLAMQKSPASEDDSDLDEDLDLELMICPCDIPELYEEVMKKKPHSSSSSETKPHHHQHHSAPSNEEVNNDNKNDLNVHNNNSSSPSESGYESTHSTTTITDSAVCPTPSKTWRQSMSKSRQPSLTLSNNKKKRLETLCDDYIVIDRISSGFTKKVKVNKQKKYTPRRKVMKTNNNNNNNKQKRQQQQQQRGQQHRKSFNDLYSMVLWQSNDKDDHYFKERKAIQGIKQRLWMLDTKLDFVED